MENLVVKSVRLQGADVLIMGSYHRGSLDKSILDSAAAWSKNGALPFVLLGDFNDAASNLVLASWARSVGAVVATPDGEATCNPSRGELSLLDFMVLSGCLFGMVRRFAVDWRVLWKPHALLGLEFSKKASEQKALMAMKPPRLRYKKDELQGNTAIWETELAKARTRVFPAAGRKAKQ